VRDRARLGLARKLRERAPSERRAGDLAATFFHPKVFSPAVAGDASFALADAIKRRGKLLPSALPSVTRIPVGAGTVSAVAWAAQTGEVFLGFARGHVLAFRPIECDIIGVVTGGAPVAGLACRRTGDQLVILRAADEDALAPVIESCLRAPYQAYRLEEKCALGDDAHELEPVLTRELAVDPGGRAILLVRSHGPVEYEEDGFLMKGATPATMATFEGPKLLPTGPIASSYDWLQVNATVLLASPLGYPHELLAFDDGGFSVFAVPSAPGDGPISRTALPWRVSSRGLGDPVIASLRTLDGHLELAAVTESGALVWTSLERVKDDFLSVETRSSSCREGYLAVALLGPGKLAGVTRSAVYWLRASGGDELGFWASTEANIGNAVAAFVCDKTNELIIVVADGYVVRVPVPS
jgi:hypothetical protein